MAIVVIAVAAAGVTRAASLRQSATFDEIILVSGGARGLEHGQWGMVTDQPPLMMWLYGAAVRSLDPVLPSEDRAWDFDERWDYARAVFFEGGADPERLLARPRLVATVVAGLVVLSAGLFALWAAGPVAGVLAALFTGLLPDLLGHGGVAYNDVPMALAFFLCIWAMDAAVRRPGPGRGASAGVALALAFGTKMSALALLPVGAALVGAEGLRRRVDRAWARHVMFAAGAGLVAAYATLVVLYGGDVTLAQLRFNFWRTVLHATGGHPAPAFLLGGRSSGGWWYYFPVAFFFKTPLGLQLALGGAAVSLAGALRSPDTDRASALHTVLDWKGRAPAIGALVFGAFLLRSDLNAGFRYALPVLPLLCVVAAVGLARAVRSTRERSRTAVLGFTAATVALSLASVATVHPWHLSYSSVWAGGRDDAWRVLSDSNVDWGQGLLELRSFMAEEQVASVRLSYFGSARPEAYGIEYTALPSFFRLSVPRTPGAEERPRFTVISATNLQGLYLQGRDPFAPYRDREPYRVLGHALFVYDDGP